MLITPFDTHLTVGGIRKKYMFWKPDDRLFAEVRRDLGALRALDTQERGVTAEREAVKRALRQILDKEP